MNGSVHSSQTISFCQLHKMENYKIADGRDISISGKHCLQDGNRTKWEQNKGKGNNTAGHLPSARLWRELAHLSRSSHRLLPTTG